MGIEAGAPTAARLAVAGLMIAGWTASAGVAWADPDQTPAPSPSPAASQGPPPGPPPSSASPAPSPGATPAAAPAPKTTMDKDGIYNVGTDIAPGIYSSGGPLDNGTCYWKRTGNPDGNIIDNAMSKKPQVVQIDPTDKAFKTSGCQPWQLTPDAALPPTTPPAGVQGTLGILNGLLGGQGGQQPPPHS
ncbi:MULTISPECIES: hypothetical protein [unclassified Mycobacterium]|uniref:hypothetical protein n=1 Tax=unclassified Mycobacterium TaxID=2642494 RepID=UPI0007FD8BFE|nr:MULTISPECIES: hypothetical protein [unclassified Mycobacterium]OBF12666.1 hypothetical protein A5730_03710 [Mycobacterium sp. ACS4054]OBH87491.1 hypothetical protein A5680_03615 [Mycobacterium sp. E2989]